MFTTSREKRLWSLVFLVLLAIVLPLVLDKPFGHLIRDQNVQTGFFVIGFAGIVISIFLYGLKNRIHTLEWVIWFGMLSVYLLVVFRLSAPERSHLIEYSILAIFIHLALVERSGHENNSLRESVLAFLITAIIGVLDECLQILLPNRVFDTNDMIFNALAALMAIGGSQFLSWFRKKVKDD